MGDEDDDKDTTLFSALYGETEAGATLLHFAILCFDEERCRKVVRMLTRSGVHEEGRRAFKMACMDSN
jgi:hypothetical protein